MKGVVIKPVEYFVRIEWSKPSLMKFLGHVPADNYNLVVTGPNEAIGVIVGTDILEFVTNEISLMGIEHICYDEYASKLNIGFKAFGDYR